MGKSLLGRKSPWTTVPWTCVPLDQGLLGQLSLGQMEQHPQGRFGNKPKQKCLKKCKVRAGGLGQENYFWFLASSLTMSKLFHKDLWNTQYLTIKITFLPARSDHVQRMYTEASYYHGKIAWGTHELYYHWRPKYRIDKGIMWMWDMV